MGDEKLEVNYEEKCYCFGNYVFALTLCVLGEESEFDFRKTKWGMTREEVKQIEVLKPRYDKSTMVTYNDRILGFPTFEIDNRLKEIEEKNINWRQQFPVIEDELNHIFQCLSEASKVCNITIEEKVLKNIFSEFTKKGREVELPLLQVVMDYLYHRAEETNNQRPEITVDIYNIGGIENIMSNFIEKQVAEFDEPETTMKILQSLVTTEGTKRVVSFKDLQDPGQNYCPPLEKEKLRQITRFQ